MFEGNPVPTLWLSNSVTELDPAFVRRFDLVLHMAVPPACQRERIFREACSNRLSDAAAHCMAMHADLTPGVVARAFEEALRDNAVLCLDEGDSFLRERTLSQRSWEVTGVNEMLSQMERFPGLLIVSTNLLDMLDMLDEAAASISRSASGSCRPRNGARISRTAAARCVWKTPAPAPMPMHRWLKRSSGWTGSTHSPSATSRRCCVGIGCIRFARPAISCRRWRRSAR
ncbi:ATPase family associated with various cellular activities (AAA) [Caballeronia calidae]|uniref:ATPase family associated with various cellular activities (AAA) n=1 Tax=Caballeronia calidae TaxID=1777139 RepID=A0A158EE34_9BURK|nr:AAA family ATPase [Caballeronia calidae]SAL05152.1 ATPase family associated with various cellular activities (AAA) [Caballeronia calidae]